MQRPSSLNTTLKTSVCRTHCTHSGIQQQRAALSLILLPLLSHALYCAGLYGGGVSVLPGHNGSGAGALVTSLVRSADVWLMAGVHLTDYSSAGHQMHAPPTAKLIEIFPRYVRVAGQTYHSVMMADFIQQLASPQLTHNTALVDEFNKRLVDVDTQKSRPESELRSAVEQKESERSKKYPLNVEPHAQLTMRTVHHHLQKWYESP